MVVKYVIASALFLLSLPTVANEQQLDIRVEDSVLWRFVADNDSYELFFRYEYEWEQPNYLFDWGVVLPLEQVQLTVGNVVASGALKLTEHLLGYGRNSGHTHTAGAIKLADGLTMTNTHGLVARFYPFEIPIAVVAGGTVDDNVQKAIFGGTIDIQNELKIESWHTITQFNKDDVEEYTEQSWFASEYDADPHRFGNSSLHLLLDHPGLDVALHGVVQYGPWLAPQGSAAFHLTAGAKPHYGSIKGGWASPLLLDASGSLSQRIWQIDGGYEFVPSKHWKLAAAYQAIGYSNTSSLQSISYDDIQWVREYQVSMDSGLVIEVVAEPNGGTTDGDEHQPVHELWLRPGGTVNYKTDARTDSQYLVRLSADAEIELELRTQELSASIGANHRWQWYDDTFPNQRLTGWFGIDGDILELSGSVQWEAEELAALLPTMAKVKLEYSQSPINWFVALELEQFPLTSESFIDDALVSAGFTVGW